MLGDHGGCSGVPITTRHPPSSSVIARHRELNVPLGHWRRFTSASQWRPPESCDWLLNQFGVFIGRP
ncbi:MAG: hypothetical protein Q8P67_27550 [archaeon]|nr:hypothetical protein [archaeon]